MVNKIKKVKPEQRLKSALDLVTEGFQVIPLHTPTGDGCSCKRDDCSSIGKHPRTPQGLNDATRNPDTIRGWWDRWKNANIGVVTGTGRGVVLDVDGSEGQKTLDLINQGHIFNRADGSSVKSEKLPDTPAVKTGNGKHLYFILPKGADIRNWSRRLPGLDLRGQGGYVVVPPSTHANGSVYYWIISPLKKNGDPLDPTAPGGGMELSTLPSWILDLGRQAPGHPAGQVDEKVHPGNRYHLLLSLAGSMRRRGMGEPEILGALRETNKIRCDPPKPDADVVALVRDVCKRYEPSETILDVAQGELKRTDLGNSRRFTRRNRSKVRYVNAWGKWIVFNGHHYTLDDTGEIMRMAKDTVRDIYIEASNHEEKGERLNISKWAFQSETAKRLKDMIDLAKSEPGIPVRPLDLDADPMVLGCRNGVIDLGTGELRPGTQNDLITKSVPIEYDPGAKCPTWTRFLKEILPDTEVVDFIRRAIGYSLTGDTGEDAVFILYGTGANGKTTFIETIKKMMGDYARHTEFSTFTQKQFDTIRNDIARLHGARFVSSSEIGRGKRLDEALIKAMTGGDTLTARYLHQEYFEFPPTFKVFLAVNHKPGVRGTERAIWRRIKLIKFDVTIEDADQDKKLQEKLILELPGILTWAVQGCQEWIKMGLASPPQVQEATEEYRVDMDELGEFITDRCIIDPGRWTSGNDLYDEYLSWAESTGEPRPMKKREFGTVMEERGFIRHRTTKARGWTGIALANAPNILKTGTEIMGYDKKNSDKDNSSNNDTMTLNDSHSGVINSKSLIKEKPENTVIKRHASFSLNDDDSASLITTAIKIVKDLQKSGEPRPGVEKIIDEIIYQYQGSERPTREESARAGRHAIQEIYGYPTPHKDKLAELEK